MHSSMPFFKLCCLILILSFSKLSYAATSPTKPELMPLTMCVFDFIGKDGPVHKAMKEYQIEAYFDFVIKSLGAQDHSFPTIAASGKNAIVLHYDENTSQVQGNDLILFACIGAFLLCIWYLIFTFIQIITLNKGIESRENFKL